MSQAVLFLIVAVALLGLLLALGLTRNHPLPD
jgi:hypothetical protein